jgi:Tol biopolymer transport system component
MTMRGYLAGLAILLLGVAPAHAAPPAGPERLFTARDLFDLEAADDPQISPDGRWIAYVRRSGDIMTDRFRRSIWLVDAATGRQMPLARDAAQPRWSPAGDRLAYIAAADGGRPQLYVRWMQSGEAVPITGLGFAPSSVAWSPDGRQLAYAMFVPDEGQRLGPPQQRPEGAIWAEPLQVITAVTYRADGQGYLRAGYDQLFLVSSEGGAPRQLSYGPFNNGGPLSWTPDGRTLLFSGNRSPDWERQGFNTEVYALDIASNRITALTSRDGPDNEPAVSPDGRLVAFTGYDDRQRGYENAILYVMNADGSNRRALTESLDRGVSGPVWAADGRALYVQYDDHGDTRVARVGLDGVVRTVAQGLAGADFDRPYTGGSFSVARDGAVALAGGSATRPADVVLVRAGPGSTPSCSTARGSARCATSPWRRRSTKGRSTPG